MGEDVLLKAGDVEITTKVARFGGISYQVANIGSVSVYSVRKINPIAAVMVFVGLAAAVFGANLKYPYADQAPIYFGVAITLIVGGFLVQSFWPKRETTFILRTSSNDVHKIVSPDGEQLEAMQQALEEAFEQHRAKRHMGIHHRRSHRSCGLRLLLICVQQLGNGAVLPRRDPLK